MGGSTCRKSCEALVRGSYSKLSSCATSVMKRDYSITGLGELTLPLVVQMSVFSIVIFHSTAGIGWEGAGLPIARE